MRSRILESDGAAAGPDVFSRGSSGDDPGSYVLDQLEFME